MSTASASSDAQGALVEARSLTKLFSTGGAHWLTPSRGLIRAVDDVSLAIRRGESLGLVGETGCGKTTIARLILRLERPSTGSILFEGEDINRLTGARLQHYRAAIQAVFQDPWSSLNPRMRVRDIVAEPMVVNMKLTGGQVRERVRQLLTNVGLDPTVGSDYPHEFSGGQRQRVALARALSMHPSLIVLDEPVSALDVSVRAQIMNLLKELQSAYGSSYLLISHNLATVRHLSHRVAVMYLGQIVEESDSEDFFEKPYHPYSKALLNAALTTRPGDKVEKLILPGEVPSPTNVPPGCRFHTRCPFAFDRCSKETPELRELSPGHKAACHLY